MSLRKHYLLKVKHGATLKIRSKSKKSTCCLDLNILFKGLKCNTAWNSKFFRFPKHWVATIQMKKHNVTFCLIQQTFTSFKQDQRFRFRCSEHSVRRLQAMNILLVSPFFYVRVKSFALSETKRLSLKHDKMVKAELF
jgi:hypothetical protein